MTAFRFPNHPPEPPMMADIPPEVTEWMSRMHQWAVDLHRQTEDAIEGLQDNVRTTDQPMLLPPATVAQLNATNPAKFKATKPRNGGCSMVYCTDETGGAIPAYSDGTNWKRVTDGATVS